MPRRIKAIDPARVVLIEGATMDMMTTSNNDQTAAPAEIQLLGRIISVDGSEASVGFLKRESSSIDDIRATVGRLLKIQSGDAVVVCVIANISLQTIQSVRDQGYYTTAKVNLVGEIIAGNPPRYRKGVTEYPVIGDAASFLTRDELKIVYGQQDTGTVRIGHLQHDSSVDSCIMVNETLSRHFAILGATGVGKSSAVALLLQRIMDTRSALRILLIDVHNEYGHCFGKRANVLNPRNLRLPFWLFNFEEMLDVLFGGRPGIEEEVEILFETIPLAKAQYLQYRSNSDRPNTLKRIDKINLGFTVDTPVPYRIADLIGLIDERLGRLENRSSRLTYHRLIQRLESINRDTRYTFMFENANVGGDIMADVLAEIFRLPSNGTPMTVIQLGGFPTEVVDAVVSVLCRMAFDFGLWSDGVEPLMLVCEEAHLYASADHSIGFGPTRRAISRIAKEGRKYGIFLGLVTQRPSELDPTILSQCSTIFAMRMANDRDQSLMKSAITDASANLLAFLPSLGTGELLAFGEGVPLPARIKVDELPDGLLHKRNAAELFSNKNKQGMEKEFIASVIERWRGTTVTVKQRLEDKGQDAGGSESHGEAQPNLAPDDRRDESERLSRIINSIAAKEHAAQAAPEPTLRKVAKPTSVVS
jgi:DNA helicase HerA-like ATPase